MYVLGSMELQQNGRSVGGLINVFVGDIITLNVRSDNTKKDEEKKIERQNNIEIKYVEKIIPKMGQDIENKSDEKCAVNAIEKRNKKNIVEDTMQIMTNRAEISEVEMENKLDIELESEPALEIVSNSVDLSDVAEQGEGDIDISITIKPDSAVIETDDSKIVIEKDENKVEIEMKTGFNITNAIESMQGKDTNIEYDIWNHTVVALEKCTIFVWDRE
eukprot:752764_1